MPLNFIAPSSIISVASVTQIQISYLGNMSRFSIIDTFNGSEFILVFFDEIGQSEEAVGSVDGVHSSPGSSFEGVSGCLYGSIDIFFSSSLDGGQDGLIIGIDDVEGLSFG